MVMMVGGLPRNWTNQPTLPESRITTSQFTTLGLQCNLQQFSNIHQQLGFTCATGISEAVARCALLGSMNDILKTVHNILGVAF